MIHNLVETVVLGDRTFFFDRENAAWSLAALDGSLLSSLDDLSLIKPQYGHRLQSPHSPWKDIEPLTVIDIPVTGHELHGERKVTFDELECTFKEWSLLDDVWDMRFLKNLYVRPKPTIHSNITISVTEDVRHKLQLKYHTSHIFHGPANNVRDVEQVHAPDSVKNTLYNTLFPGPHFVSFTDGRLMPAFGLYEDKYETFTQSTYSPSMGKILPLRIHMAKSNTLCVAVSSRLQSHPTTVEKPLAGLRFSVKDIFYISDLGPPNLGSRAWVSITEKNSPELQRSRLVECEDSDGIVKILVKLGAIFVGKNKLSEFAFAGPYHWQNPDYLLNFNPRADGLQAPSDSSGGSASAVAAYDWLDFAIGTDTGGSVRLPADANGVYGGRPTTGLINIPSMRMQSLAKSLDTVGVLARDPILYCRVLRALIKSQSTTLHAPLLSSPLPGRLKIIVPNKDYLLTQDECLSDTITTADAVFEVFIRALETSLDLRREYVILDSLWEDTKEKFKCSQPQTESDMALGSIGDEFGDLYRKIVYWESYRDLGRPFMEVFAAQNGGRLPLINNSAKAAWKTIEGGEISESMYREALVKKHMLKSWVKTYLTEADSPVPILLVSRGSTNGEDLRDTQSDERYFVPSKPGHVLPFNHLSTLADLSDHHVPIGQSGGPSSVTSQTEIYPVAASLAVSPGGEGTMFELMDHLRGNGVLQSVKTGRTAF